MRRNLASIAFTVMTCICAATSRAQTVPPIVGTWTLNRQKSQMRAVPAGWFEIRQYSLRPDGYLAGLLVTSNDRGVHYLQFTAKSDGRDYAEYSDDLLADMIAAAKPTTRSYAETIIDELTTAWTDKVDGKVVAAGRKIVSKDQQTLTFTVDGRPQIIATFGENYLISRRDPRSPHAISSAHDAAIVRDQ